MEGDLIENVFSGEVRLPHETGCFQNAAYLFFQISEYILTDNPQDSYVEFPRIYRVDFQRDELEEEYLRTMRLEGEEVPHAYLVYQGYSTGNTLPENQYPDLNPETIIKRGTDVTVQVMKMILFDMASHRDFAIFDYDLLKLGLSSSQVKRRIEIAILFVKQEGGLEKLKQELERIRHQHSDPTYYDLILGVLEKAQRNQQ